MDSRLLTEARRAQERLIDAERDAEVARAEFNQAVQRLHLAGSSPREVADGLGLSQQRVRQIVEASDDPQLLCTFCGRPRNKVRNLIAGPGVYICEGCVGLANTAISSGEPARTQLGAMTAVPEQQTRARCSFCGKNRYQAAGLAALSAQAGGTAVPDACICTECLALCDEINAEELAGPSGPA